MYLFNMWTSGFCAGGAVSLGIWGSDVLEIALPGVLVCLALSLLNLFIGLQPVINPEEKKQKKEEK